MTTATLSRLTEGKPWHSEKWGKDYEVWNLHFEDGSVGELSVLKGNLSKAKQKLDPLIGQPADYDLEPTKLDKRFKVKDYPSKAGEDDRRSKKSYNDPEVQAEIMAQSMLYAAVNLCANEWSAIRFDRAIELVKEGMGDLLTYTREALKVEAATGGPLSETRGSGGTTPYPAQVRPAASTVSEAPSENVGAPAPSVDGRVSVKPGVAGAPTPRSDGEAKEPSRGGEGALSAPASSSDSIPAPHKYRGDGEEACLTCSWFLEAEHHR